MVCRLRLRGACLELFDASGCFACSLVVWLQAQGFAQLFGGIEPVLLDQHYSQVVAGFRRIWPGSYDIGERSLGAIQVATLQSRQPLRELS